MTNGFRNILTDPSYDRLVTIALLDNDKTKYKVHITERRRFASGDFIKLATRADTNDASRWPIIVSIDFSRPQSISSEQGTGSVLDLHGFNCQIKHIVISPPDNLIYAAEFSPMDRITLGGFRVKASNTGGLISEVTEQYLDVYADGRVVFSHRQPALA